MANKPKAKTNKAQVVYGLIAYTSAIVATSALSIGFIAGPEVNAPKYSSYLECMRKIGDKKECLTLTNTKGLN